MTMTVQEPAAQYLAKAGYRQSKMGVIPTEWQQRTVGELIEFQGGSQPEKTVFSATPRPGFVRLIQIRDYKSDRFEVYAPAALLRRFCDQKDIMIGRYGPPVFQILRGLTGAYNVALIKAIPCPDIDREFAFYFLKQDSLFEFIDNLSRRSSGQTGVDLYELRRYPLPLPPISEQRAIATALSDVDALIAGLERLIAKKRDIKQAAMQQLLTGQTRLPGFSGEWASVQLGELLDVRHGKNQHAVEAPDGPYPILATGGQIGTASQPLHDRPSVLIGRKGTINKPQYMDTPFWTVDTLFYCDVHPPNSAKFLYYRFLLIDWMQYNEASGVPSLNGRTIERIDIDCPSPEEQTAIATVLSDMDADLAALESRLAKTRAIKQGMMQELLTGRTRLV